MCLLLLCATNALQILKPSQNEQSETPLFAGISDFPLRCLANLLRIKQVKSFLMF